MKFLFVLLLGMVLGGSIIVGVIYLNNNPKTAQKSSDLLSPTANPSATPAPINSPTVVLSNTGFIEGSLSYPSSGIPANMSVCAETLNNVLVVCTNDHIKDAKYQYGEGYRLEVAAGSYYVYAKLPESSSKAYYSEFVTCGLKFGCPSHNPIKVVVNASETKENIDPQDWYNQ